MQFAKSVFDCMPDFILGPLSAMCSKLVHTVKIDLNSALAMILKQIALLHFYSARNSK